MSIEIFVDLDRKFKKKSDGNLYKTNTQETINQSIKTILSTVPGERIMLPDFGSNIKFLLFEPMDFETVILIREEIKHRINQWEDRITVTNVDVIPDEDRNVYKVVIRYVYLIDNVEHTLSTNLKSFV